MRAESPREVRFVVATPITTDRPRQEKLGAEGAIVPACAPLRRGAQVRMHQTRSTGTARNPTLPPQIGEVEVPLAAAKCDPPRLREDVSVEHAGNEHRRPGTRRRFANNPRRGRRPRRRDDSDGDRDEACQQKSTPRRHAGNLVVATLRANTSSGDIYEHSPSRCLSTMPGVRAGSTRPVP